MTFLQLLEHLEHVPQDPIHHPEGNVLMHTAIVRSNVSFSIRNEDLRAEMMAAALFHDTGKLTTTIPHPTGEPGRFAAHGHEKVSLMFLEEFGEMMLPDTNLDIVRFLVKHHMRAKHMDKMRPSKVVRLREEAEALHPMLFWRLKMFLRADSKERMLERFPTKQSRVEVLDRFKLFMYGGVQRIEHLHNTKIRRTNNDE